MTSEYTWKNEIKLTELMPPIRKKSLVGLSRNQIHDFCVSLYTFQIFNQSDLLYKCK